MEKLDREELVEILSSYGLKNPILEEHRQVEPDTTVYVFRDSKKTEYILLVADYLGGYDDFELPHEFIFDYYQQNRLRFNAIRRLSYTDDAPKTAIGYVDDNHLLTRASTGDVCMLFEANNIKFN